VDISFGEYRDDALRYDYFIIRPRLLLGRWSSKHDEKLNVNVFNLMIFVIRRCHILMLTLLFPSLRFGGPPSYFDSVFANSSYLICNNM
jgi:hypothetical protein